MIFAAVLSGTSSTASADSLVAPIGDQLQFAPEKPARRRPAAVLPESDDIQTQNAKIADKDAETEDDKTEAAWILPKGYTANGCENCGVGIRSSGLSPIPMNLIQKGE